MLEHCPEDTLQMDTKITEKLWSRNKHIDIGSVAFIQLPNPKPKINPPTQTHTHYKTPQQVHSPIASIWKLKVSSADSFLLDLSLPCKFTIFMQPLKTQKSQHNDCPQPFQCIVHHLSTNRLRHFSTQFEHVTFVIITNGWKT